MDLNWKTLRNTREVEKNTTARAKMQQVRPKAERRMRTRECLSRFFFLHHKARASSWSSPASAVGVCEGNYTILQLLLAALGLGESIWSEEEAEEINMKKQHTEQSDEGKMRRERRDSIARLDRELQRSDVVYCQVDIKNRWMIQVLAWRHTRSRYMRSQHIRLCRSNFFAFLIGFHSHSNCQIGFSYTKSFVPGSDEECGEKK